LWTINLAFSGNRFDAAFSIEPSVGIGKTPNLGQLQRESKIIADGLVQGVRAQARRSHIDLQEAKRRAA